MVSSRLRNWAGDYTEKYLYDSSLDYLTGATYDGSTPSQIWTYDAAGNRTSDSSNSGTWTYDNLNRMTASPGYTYTNSTTGSRLTRKVSGTTETAYTWDVLDRMTKTVQGSTTINYSYRADGLRYKKAYAGGAATKYRYDGQMPVEEMVGSGGTTTRFGNGARGMDYMLAGTAVSFPVYDGHGNMVGTLARSGSSFALSNQRKYDVWGSVRSGSGTGDPKQRHCANLGHIQDDDTGLIYMRARYYEAGTGRFVSQDNALDGWNLFIYCGNEPVGSTDFTGKAGRSNPYNFGDWSVVFDMSGSDYHVFNRGVEVLSRYFSGGIKHAKTDQGDKCLAEFLEALNDAMKSGNQRAIACGGKMRRNSVIGVSEHLGFAIVAITSLDAYAQYDPGDFADIIVTIGSFGRN